MRSGGLLFRGLFSLGAILAEFFASIRSRVQSFGGSFGEKPVQFARWDAPITSTREHDVRESTGVAKPFHGCLRQTCPLSELACCQESRSVIRDW